MVASLAALGCAVDASSEPWRVSGRGGRLRAAPYAGEDVALRFLHDRLVSRPYVDLTIDVMRAFGANAEWDGSDTVRVSAGVHYQARRYAVEADASSAAYPFCAAAIAGGR